MNPSDTCMIFTINRLTNILKQHTKMTAFSFLTSKVLFGCVEWSTQQSPTLRGALFSSGRADPDCSCLHQPHCPANLSWVRDTPGSFLVTGLQTRGHTTWQNPKFFQNWAPRAPSFQAALEPGGDSGGMHLKGGSASLSQVLSSMHVSGCEYI